MNDPRHLPTKPTLEDLKDAIIAHHVHCRTLWSVIGWTLPVFFALIFAWLGWMSYQIVEILKKIY